MSTCQALLTGEPLVGFLDDWRTHLRARNRSAGTIESYLTVGRAFCDYLDREGADSTHLALSRGTIEGYLAELNDRLAPATAAKHYRSLQQLFRRLVSDGELDRSSMEHMSAPSVPEQPVPVLASTSSARCSSRARETPSRTVGTPQSSGCSSTPGCAPESWPG